MRLPLKIIAATYLSVLLGACLAPAALAVCCGCHLAPDTSVVCMTSSAANDCPTLLAQSSSTLKGFACDPTPLDPDSSCKPTNAGAPAVCIKGPFDAATYSSTSTPTTQGFTAIVPNLNVPIPGLFFATTDTITTTGHQRSLQEPILAQYIAGVYNYMLGISVIAAAVMIVWGGIKYILGATAGDINSAKETIVNSVVGLILVFSIYTILKVINPATLALSSLQVPIIDPQIYTIPENVYQNFQQDAAKQGYKPDPAIASAIKSATGGTQPAGTRMFPNNPFDPRTTLPSDQMKTILTTIAQKDGLDPCILIAIANTESGNRENAVGHDEDANYVGVPARLNFLRSGKYYSGKIFDPPNIPPDPPGCGGANRTSCQQILNQNSNIRNDDSLTADPPDYGLDWRFSHGFGYAQCTISRKTVNSCIGPDGGNGVRLGGVCFTVPILMTWEGQTDCLARIIKAMPSHDPCTIFQNYSGDKQDTTCSDYLLSKKMAAYTACKGG